MKKVMYFLFLNLFCLAATGGYAQNFSGGDDETGGEGLEDEIPTLTVSESGDGGDTVCYHLRRAVDVYAANLVFDPVDKRYVIPAGTPEIYVRTSVGGISTNPMAAAYLWAPMGIHGPSGEPIFKAKLPIEIDYESICGDTSLVEYEILAKYRGLYYPYPICDHRTPGQVYSCNVFADIPCSREKPCTAGTINYLTEDVYLSCSCDYAASQFMTTNPSINTNPISDTGLQPALDITPLNNPFQDNLSIRWKSSSEQAVSFELYNVTGQLVRSSLQSDRFGEYNMNTAGLPTGLYILVACSGPLKETIKLIKS